MKRPLAIIGFTMLITLTVCFYLNYKFSLAFLLVSVAGLAVSLVFKKVRKRVTPVAVFAVIMLTVVGFSLFSGLYVIPLQTNYGGTAAEICATVCEEGKPYRGYTFYELKVLSVDGEKADFKLQLASKDAIMAEVGDKVKFTAELETEAYSKTLADRMYICTCVYEEESVAIIPTENKPLYYYAVKLRSALRSALYLEMDSNSAALSASVLLGDKSGISDDISRDLRYAGMSHIAVVSGLHLSIATMICDVFIRRLTKNKYINTIATIFVVLLFLALTGFGRSTVRAAVMLFVLLAARLFNRESDSLNSLGFAAIILCAANPYAVGDIGMLLSFSATASIVTLGACIEKELISRYIKRAVSVKLINKLIIYIIRLFACIFSAAAGTLPVSILFFGKVSLVQIFSNMFAVPLVPFLLWFSLIVAVLHYIPFLSVITDIFAYAADIVAKAILGIANSFASIPVSYVRADYAFTVFWLLATVLLLLTAYYLRRGRGVTLLCIALSGCILLSGAIGHLICYKDVCSLYILPSKSGHTLVLNSSDGNVVLSVSGKDISQIKLAEELEQVYTDGQLMVVYSHNNTASKTAEYITDLFDYETVLMYDTDDSSNSAHRLKASVQNYTEVCGNYNVSLWNKAYLSIIEAEGEVYEYLVCGSTTVLILPPFGNALNIPEDMRSVDVLISAGMIDNMELLSFDMLVADGNDFESASVISFYKDRAVVKTVLDNTFILDLG